MIFCGLLIASGGAASPMTDCETEEGDEMKGLKTNVNNLKHSFGAFFSGTALLCLGLLPVSAYALQDEERESAFDGMNALPSLFQKETSLDRMRAAIGEVESDGEVRGLLAPSSNGVTLNGLLPSNRITGEELETTKFQHFYKGIEVFGSMSFHTQSRWGAEIRNTLKRFDIETMPSLAAESVVGIAQSLAGSRALEKAPELKIFPDEESDSARLVYWVDLEETALDGAREMIIDAHSGEVLGNLSKHLTLAPVQVYSAKNQGIALEPVMSQKAPDQLESCKVTDIASQKQKTIDSGSCMKIGPEECQILIDGDPVMVNPGACKQTVNNSRIAAGADASSKTAARNSTAVLKYFEQVHKRNSYDGKGSALVSVVHAGQAYSNAHWNLRTNQMVYGDGDGKVVGDFTQALDVAGHEMAHGLTAHTAKLLGMGESGALNEAYSDFFGKMIENNGDWALGRGIFIDKKAAKGVRDLANPGNLVVHTRDKAGKPISKAYPAHIKDKFVAQGTCDGSNDNCWVHVNATIPGHASYLVVQAIGKEKAEKLYFATLTQALGPRDDIKSAAQATLRICGQLYDAATCGLVQGAFDQVGLKSLIATSKKAQASVKLKSKRKLW